MNRRENENKSNQFYLRIKDIKRMNSPATYDIIVVGAGPAGSLTARTAAEHGANVLILEEHEQAGTPVYCAEALGMSGFNESGLEPVEPLIAQKTNKVMVITPNRKIVALSPTRRLKAIYSTVNTSIKH